MSGFVVVGDPPFVFVVSGDGVGGGVEAGIDVEGVGAEGFVVADFGVEGSEGFECAVAEVFGVHVVGRRVAEDVEITGCEGGGGDSFGGERVFGFDFPGNAGAEVAPSAVACNAGKEVEGVGACAVSVFDFAPSAAEGFLADGVAGAAFGDGEGFDLGDDIVAEFVEAFRAGGVDAALMLYFAEKKGEFCGLLFHGFWFCWRKGRGMF